MREIKFRAWEPDSKTMYPKAIVGEPANPSVWTESNWRECTENVIIMQYTGLKDKNGKEIYEGDIVKSDNGEKAEVKWSDVRLGWNMVYQRYELPLFERFLEVIGNIYENPELLSKEDK